eukprot:2631346-Rhodomonas_salina.2
MSGTDERYALPGSREEYWHCPVLARCIIAPGTILRYALCGVRAISGTGVGFAGGSVLRTCYSMSGTDVGFAGTRHLDKAKECYEDVLVVQPDRYQVGATCYAPATRCPVCRRHPLRA